MTVKVTVKSPDVVYANLAGLDTLSEWYDFSLYVYFVDSTGNRSTLIYNFTAKREIYHGLQPYYDNYNFDSGNSVIKISSDDRGDLVITPTKISCGSDVTFDSAKFVVSYSFISSSGCEYVPINTNNYPLYSIQQTEFSAVSIKNVNGLFSVPGYVSCAFLYVHSSKSSLLEITLTSVFTTMVLIEKDSKDTKYTVVQYELKCTQDPIANWGKALEFTMDDSPAVTLYGSKMIVTPKYQLGIVKFAYMYMCLVDEQGCDMDYPESYTFNVKIAYSLIPRSNFHWKISRLPTNSNVSQMDRIKAVMDLGMSPEPSYFHDSVPSDVMSRIMDGRALYILIELQRVDCEFDPSNSTYFYQHVLIYADSRGTFVKNLHNNAVYPMEDFLQCFSIDFKSKTMKETDTYDKQIIEQFLPCNVVYGTKKVIPVYFYMTSVYTLSFYTNRQYVDDTSIVPVFDDYINFENLYNAVYACEIFVFGARVYGCFKKLNDNTIFCTSDVYEFSAHDGNCTSVTISDQQSPVTALFEVSRITLDVSILSRPRSIQFKLLLHPDKENINVKKMYIHAHKSDNSLQIDYTYQDFGYNAGLEECVELHVYLKRFPLLQPTKENTIAIAAYFTDQEYSKTMPSKIHSILAIVKTKQTHDDGTEKDVMLCMLFANSRIHVYYGDAFKESNCIATTMAMTYKILSSGDTVEVRVLCSGSEKVLSITNDGICTYYPDVDMFFNHGTLKTSGTDITLMYK